MGNSIAELIFRPFPFPFLVRAMPVTMRMVPIIVDCATLSLIKITANTVENRGVDPMIVVLIGTPSLSMDI